MDHDWYNFVSHFWWLVFPFVWMLAAFVRITARHRESQRILDMIQSYTAQGKEPPAALVEMFKAPRMGRGRGCNGYDRYSEPYYTHRLWRRAFLFAFLCVLFAGSAWWRHTYPGDMDHREFGWIIAALVLGALALSNLMALMTRPKLPPSDFRPDQK
ncbi:MAG TPA: hypothetical protein VHZ32_04930 [Rhizomicrobium sp.]|jgi:hypothetical protein|nr:hypothetical protein [Rhizomicrobium sp.]